MSWDRMPGTGTEVPTIGEFLAGNPVPHLVPHDMSVTLGVPSGYVSCLWGLGRPPSVTTTAAISRGNSQSLRQPPDQQFPWAQGAIGYDPKENCWWPPWWPRRLEGQELDMGPGCRLRLGCSTSLWLQTIPQAEPGIRDGEVGKV